METLEDIRKTLAEASRISKENSILIGKLGNKFGSFTEAMALPSMERILEKQFGMTYIFPRFRVRKNGQVVQEIDLLAYSNGTTNTAIVVEVKSDLKGSDIDQVQKIMDNFSSLFPEHKDKKLYGIIAYVDASEEGKRKALKSGFYLASIYDELFEMKTPSDFKPKDFSKRDC